MMWTSSTPAVRRHVEHGLDDALADVGHLRIFGSGRLMSSNAIVSFMPWEQQCRQRVLVDRVQQRVADRAVDVVEGGQRLGG